MDGAERWTENIDALNDELLNNHLHAVDLWVHCFASTVEATSEIERRHEGLAHETIVPQRQLCIDQENVVSFRIEDTSDANDCERACVH